MATRRRQQQQQPIAEGTERLSQLSDIESLGQAPELGSQPGLLDAPPLLSSQGLTQELDQLPSQPLLPTPELCSADVARPDTSGACAPREPERERPLSRFSTRREASRMFMLQQQSPDGHVAPASSEPRAKPSRKATRRGPMDEMRQLVRILVKVIPHSADNIRASEEGGGGNRISEDQIKSYLSSTLGEAPRPQWGVPEGWGAYLAELFSWVAARPVTADEAQRCAKRDPGRSWEAIDSELAALGLLPATWPLPLSRAGLAAALVPAQQQQQQQGAASPARSGGSPAHKHAAEGSLTQAVVKRLRGSPTASEELSLWSDALEAVNNAAAARSGSSSPGRAAAIARIKAEIQAKVQGTQLAMPLLLAPQPPTLVPVSVHGAGGELQTAYQLQMPGSLSQPPPLCLGGELPASLDAGAGLSLSQVLLSQPGTSAFQAVKPASPLQGTHGLLEPPPPLRLSPLGRSPSEAAGVVPASPSTDSDDGSAVFHSSRLASPRAQQQPAGLLFKPTALKSDAAQPLELPGGGQGEARARPASPAAAPAPEQPAAAAAAAGAQPPVLGFLANGTFLPLGALPPASQSLALPTMQAQGSGALAPASATPQQPWVPNLSASLS